MKSGRFRIFFKDSGIVFFCTFQGTALIEEESSHSFTRPKRLSAVEGVHYPDEKWMISDWHEFFAQFRCFEVEVEWEQDDFYLARTPVFLHSYALQQDGGLLTRWNFD